MKHDGEKLAMWNLTHSRFIKSWISNIKLILIQTFIKYVLPAKVRAINCYRANHHSARKRLRSGEEEGRWKKLCVDNHKYDIDGKHHLGFKFQKIYPRFHVTNLSLHNGKIKISGLIVAHRVAQNFICEQIMYLWIKSWESLNSASPGFSSHTGLQYK